MSLNPNTSFRRGAFALAAIAGASTLALFPAAAQQMQASPAASRSEQVTVDTDCGKYQPGVLMADTKCEILKGQALDTQGRALDVQKDCMERLLAFKNAAPEQFKKLGRITRENACEAAGRISKPTASAGPALGG